MLHYFKHVIPLTMSIMGNLLGARQQLLNQAMERAPPRSFLDALDALLRWIDGVESLLDSEPVVTNFSGNTEEQLHQYRVSIVTVTSPTSTGLVLSLLPAPPVQG